MIGVNFQPGVSGTGPNARTGDTGVQEAIKVLSLRLPKVVGAQGIAAAPLLTSQGSGGSRVDSVVNSILGRMFPTGDAGGEMPGTMPSFGTAPDQPYSGGNAPTFSGIQGGYGGPSTPEPVNPWSKIPRIIADGGPIGVGDFNTGIGGGNGGGSGNPPGVYEELPAGFAPPAPAPRPSQPTYQPYAMPDPPEMPLF